MEYGLIGKVLGHSYSKEIHEQIADYQYELKELKPEELDGFMKARDFKAINVTIPYKQDVIPYLDIIDEQAELIGAVNTVVNREGKLYGYNTDFSGMIALIRKTGIDLKGRKVLILGTGGTAKTAHAVALKLCAGEILHVSRHSVEESSWKIVSYREAEEVHTDAQVIINTTPSGMYPKTEDQPIRITGFRGLEGVIDAVYNPLRSNLVLSAQEKGIPAEGGLYMLSAQAVYACGLFLNRTAGEAEIEKAFQNVRKEKQNIVLCGMPSCGKTTVAKELEQILNKPVIDTDERVIQKIGMEIKDYAALHGEKAFRDAESEAVKEVSKESGTIIATGGGVVLRPENVRELKRNGRIFFIDRPIEKLTATPDRPFSSDPEALRKRFEERYDIYCRTADVRIDGSGSVSEVAKEILERL